MQFVIGKKQFIAETQEKKGPAVMGMINLYRNKNPIVHDAFEQAVFHLCLQKEQLSRSAFFLCGTAPCVGTSTVAMELAISLANAGWRTLLMDCNLRKSALAKRINDGTSAGLSDYLMDQVDFERIVYRTNWDLLHCIPPGKSGVYNPLHLLYSQRMQSALEQTRADYDFVLIDGPAFGTVADAEVIAHAVKCCILVTALDGSKRKSLESAKKRLESMQIPLAGVIANKAEPREYRQYAHSYDYYNESHTPNLRKNQAYRVDYIRPVQRAENARTL